MLNGYEISLKTTIHPIFSMQHLRNRLWTSMRDLFGSGDIPTMFTSTVVSVLCPYIVHDKLIAYAWHETDL